MKNGLSPRAITSPSNPLLNCYADAIFIVQDLHMVELEDFKYGGTNITAFRLVDPNDELVQVLMMIYI